MGICRYGVGIIRVGNVLVETSDLVFFAKLFGNVLNRRIMKHRNGFRNWVGRKPRIRVFISSGELSGWINGFILLAIVGLIKGPDPHSLKGMVVSVAF